ncbi:MAG: hypothetical protein LBR11_02550 [Deltaproteobacteria bacterium]|jgi:hypothetical protein|nr:hypothetical protein [Deltaproteobacteria bacterium]
MKISLARLVTCLLALGLLWGSPTLWAQNQIEGELEIFDPESDPYFVDGFTTPFNSEKEANRVDGPGNSIDPALPKVEIQELSWQAANPDFPPLSAKVSVYYPARTGSLTLDQRLALEAQDMLAKGQQIFSPEFLADMTPAEEDRQRLIDSNYSKVFQARRTFDLYSPRPGLISLLFTANLDTFGNHPSTEFYSASFEVASGRELTLQDVFPDWAQSGPKFWAYLKKGFCALKESENTLPRYFSSVEFEAKSCAADPPLPKIYQAPQTLRELGNPVLTKDGLFLFLGPYDGYGYVMGPISLSIPKKDLLEMGASPSLWAKK